MRLELRLVLQGCRRGVLTGVGRSGDHSLELPGCLLYTRCGTVPHLTHQTLHTLQHLPAVTLIPMDSLVAQGLWNNLGTQVVCLEVRCGTIKETAKRPVGGFVLDGLHSHTVSQELRSQLIAAVTKELPEDKPRVLLGVGRPDEVLECVEAGVDFFETVFPFQVTERGCALCFSYDLDPDPESSGTPYTLTQRAQCYCCKNHQRAYLHHLLVTNELLAGVLLMLHNLEQYCSFFQSLRGALEGDKLNALKKRILQRRDCTLWLDRRAFSCWYDTTEPEESGVVRAMR
ncbi:hypothetical protein JZ751_013982 [Albula glossodonta]|uniref:tRNA-guanine(15) transglycosylase-like domain-containing protein n=1 Tax=Albula glossodonta TaxID=121402 RepID=A0A8T2MYY2_9TELE|nr:hypothetical protein JZ751_013982 [Albula glossodonta]